MSEWAWVLVVGAGILVMYVVNLHNQNNEHKQRIANLEQQVDELQEELNQVRSFSVVSSGNSWGSIFLWALLLVVVWLTLGGKIPGLVP